MRSSVFKLYMLTGAKYNNSPSEKHSSSTLSKAVAQNYNSFPRKQEVNN